MISKYIISSLLLIPTLFASSIAFASEQPTDQFILPPDGQKDQAFHMVVIGDSIAWGNGLLRENKFSYIVADWLQKKLDRPVNVTVYAHSGATISGSGESCTPIDPNLNSGCPTLMDQANALKTQNDVDLILVSGGINDVGVLNILDTNSVSDTVTERSKEVYGSMKDLLSNLLKNGDAKIIVTDYYPIVTYSTEEKYFSMLNDVFDLRTQAVNNFVVEEARLNLISNSNAFQGISHISLKNAVNDSNNGSDRVALASVYFKDNNSYGASDTYLWKLLSLAPPKTDDDFFEERAKLCEPIEETELFNKDFKINENWLKQVDPKAIDNYINYINAIGHPNRDGAKEYARAIESVVESKGLEWLKNESAITSKANAQESIQQASSTASVESINQPRISWIRKNHLYTGKTATSSIQQTSDGGYVIASTYNFNDIRLAKTDANGDLVWDMKFEGPEEENLGNTDERAFSVRQMSDGGYNILGSTNDVNGNFVWIIKTDSQGNITWDKTVEEQNEIIGGSQTNDGGYIIPTFSLINKNVGLCLIDSDGNKLWDKYFEETTFNPSIDTILPVQQTKDGGYTFACYKGYYDGNSLIKNGTLLIKTDGQGNELWRKLFSPPELSMNSTNPNLIYELPKVELETNCVNFVQETSDGGYVVAGSKEIRDRVLEHLSYGDKVEYFRNSYGAIIKTDSSGNVVWNKTIDICEKADRTVIYFVLQTNDGGYLLVGSSHPCDSVGIIKTDSTGNEEWNKTFDLYGIVSSVSSVLQTSDGGYLIGGDSDFSGPWLVKLGGNEDNNDMMIGLNRGTDLHEQQEMNAENESENNQSGIKDGAVTSKMPGFSGILTIASLICIFILSRRD